MKRLIFAFIRKPLWSGLIVFVITVLLSFGFAFQSYLIDKNEKQNALLKELNSANYRLKTAINNGVSASKILAFIINKYGVPKDFDSIAKNILESNKNIDAIELTKKGVITHIYPLKGNEVAMGLDVLGDSIANKEAQKAIKKKELYFAGPLELRQGGMAVVGRLPLFTDDKFEGFSVVIIKLSTLLKAAGLTQESNQFIYQFSKLNPVTLKEDYFLPTHAHFDTAQSISAAVPEGEWKLYVMYKDWKVPFEVIALFFLGLIFSVTAGLFTWYLSRQPDKLAQMVDKKTAELFNIQSSIRYSEARLAEAQEVAKIGSWETDLVTLNVIWSKEIFKIFEIEGEIYPTSHSNFLKFVHPKDQEKVEKAFTNSLNNNILNTIQHRIITQKGNIKHVEERWRISHNEKDIAVRAVGTCQDISDRIKTEEALRENEKKYKYLFENNPMPMFLWDFETLQIIDCNEEALMKYGYTRSEFLNLTIKELRPLEDIPFIEDVVKSEEVYANTHRKVWRHRKKNGELMFFNINAHLINYEGKRVSLVMIDDVTEKLKVETEIVSSYNQLQELTAHLQVIREEERTRIAREIHDELGQQLTALKMDTAWISKKITNGNEPITEKLSNMLSLIDETVKTIRRISSDLRPGILDDLGLIPALEWQGDEYEKRTGIKLKFCTNISDITLEPKISTNIFRIFQEALTNIIRHASATEIEVSVEKKDNDLKLVIKDNGHGFELNKLKSRHSWGIVGMKERAILLNGELIIESEQLKGTSITLKIPIT